MNTTKLLEVYTVREAIAWNRRLFESGNAARQGAGSGVLKRIPVDAELKDRTMGCERHKRRDRRRVRRILLEGAQVVRRERESEGRDRRVCGM